MNQLDQAIWDTIAYAGIFEMPLTATQIWRQLIVVKHQPKSQPSLADIHETLRESVWLQERVGTKYGYYFPKRKKEFVETWLTRHAIAQQKWKKVRTVMKLLVFVPTMQMSAGSGSLAVHNTKPSSDWDIFTITSANRIWFTRFCILIVLQVLGKRRKHWDQEAPDKICCNHYITVDQPGISTDIHNVYTAMLYSTLVPLINNDAMKKFQQANAEWINQYVMSPVLPNLHHLYAIPEPTRWRTFWNAFMQEPIWDWVEYSAKKIQMAIIAKHKQGKSSGRIVTNDQELAFHPDTKVPSILALFDTI